MPSVEIQKAATSANVTRAALAMESNVAMSMNVSMGMNVTRMPIASIMNIVMTVYARTALPAMAKNAKTLTNANSEATPVM
jgi:hypothetical protein